MRLPIYVGASNMYGSHAFFVLQPCRRVMAHSKNMDCTFLQEEILFMDENKVLSLKGKRVVITKVNGDVVSSYISNIIGASNSPHLPCGFILSNGMEIGFASIKTITINVNEKN